MARLPALWTDSNAELDANNWGQILKDFLLVSMSSTGTLTPSSTITFSGNGSGILFPDPTAGNSNTVAWNNSTYFPAIQANSAGTGITISVLQSEFIFSILRRDGATGSQTIGSISFEGVNTASAAFRVGYIRGKQTDNTSGSEDGYINVEAITAGTNTEWARFGADAGGSIGVWAITGLGSNQFLAINGSVAAGLYNNGATGFLGTLTNHAMKLRQNNTDVITLTAPGNITFHSYGSGSGAVSVGAADSGGAGFKVLRVPN